MRDTILFVDDHHAFRTVIGEILRQRGYAVFEAETRADVEHLMGQRPAPFNIAIIAVVLGTDNGVELAKKIEARCPGTRILFISEDEPGSFRARGFLPVEYSFLRKAFRAEEFCSRIEELLGKAAGTLRI